MELNITHELAALRRLTPRELRQRYAEVFGETAQHQEQGLAAQAHRLAAAGPGRGRPVRARPPTRRRAGQRRRPAHQPAPHARACAEPAAAAAAPAPALPPSPADRRLPPPGTVLTRTYKGARLQVRVLADGFEYDGQVYPSLSAVAKAITG